MSEVSKYKEFFDGPVAGFIEMFKPNPMMEMGASAMVQDLTTADGADPKMSEPGIFIVCVSKMTGKIISTGVKKIVAPDEDLTVEEIDDLRRKFDEETAHVGVNENSLVGFAWFLNYIVNEIYAPAGNSAYAGACLYKILNDIFPESHDIVMICEFDEHLPADYVRHRLIKTWRVSKKVHEPAEPVSEDTEQPQETVH
jgi:hypothetical protein